MEKRTFRIGYVVEKLKVERYTLRFWEEVFDLKIQRTPAGQRRYTDEDIQKIALIKKLRYEVGLTVKGIKRYLKGERNDY